MGVLATSTTVFLFIFFLQSIQTFHSLPHMERQLLDDSGYINIDCGSANVSYEETDSGLYYVSDYKYINTGKNWGVSSIYKSTWRFLLTLRSFPEGRRNCYKLWPLKPNNKYLIRARFMYGNYDNLNSIPQFDMYIGINLWLRVTFLDVGTRLIKEIIHVATTTSIDVCLVNTGKGTPFISALELRPLHNSSYPASTAFSLTLWNREDIGGTLDGRGYGRYPVHDDGYDRLWIKSPTWPGWNVISTNATVDVSQDNPLKVPASVLMNGGEDNSLVNLTNENTEDIIPNTEVYAYWYFAELESLGNNATREFNIDVAYGPGYQFGPITPKYLQLTTITSPRISFDVLGGFEFTLTKTKNSTRFPILNAVEIYTVLELPIALPTNQEDVDAITTIKDKYVVPRIWQGDPCLPVDYQWDGLNCTYDNKNSPRITSLNLSSSSLTGEIPPSLSNLTSLNYLNLSNNGFTGSIPKFLAYIPSLNVIDFTGNNLAGPVPRELIEKARNKSIDLRLEGNPDICKSYPCNNKEVNKKNHRFIIPLVICVASVLFLVIIGVTFLAFKRKKKQGLVDQAIKPKNKRFKSLDIVKITDNFKKVVGKGGFGFVYYGVLNDGTQVAVKVLNNTSSPITVKHFCAEAELLTRIHHVNLVSLIGYCDEHTNMALVYEYMSSGNLEMHLSERNEHPLTWKARIQISIDAAQGLEYLHSGCRPPIIHRDVKPSNILLDEMGHAKISDFGLSRFFTTNSQGVARSTDPAGTRGYLDPEYFQVTTLSEKSDVYAFGVVLLQLLTGLPTPIKQTDSDDGEYAIHIVDWVSPIIESADISAVVDKRLQGNLIVNSAWKFLEIAMECVKPMGNERPRMSEVVADLKMCYDVGGFNEPNDGFNNGKYSVSSQAFDSTIVSEPSAR